MPHAPQPAKADTQVRGRGRDLTLIGIAGEYVFERIRTAGAFYEADVLEILSHLPVPAERVIVDVGANIGNHAVYFAEFLDRPVVAVEPQGENADLLDANLGINGLRSRTRVVRRPLWSGPQRLTLTQNTDNNSGTYAAAASADGEFEAIALDDLLLEGERAGLIKIDTEGSEALILAGGQRVLDRDHPFLCVEAHDGAAFRGVSEILAPIGYEVLDVAGRSSNYIWVHPESSSAGPMASLRQLTTTTAQRRIRKQIDRRVDGLGRKLDGTEDEVEAIQGALSEASERVTQSLTRLPDRVVDDARALLKELQTDILSAVGNMIAESWSKELRAAVTSGHSTQQEIQKALARLIAQGDAASALDKERAQLRSALNEAQEQVRRLETEKQLWQASYAMVARSRPVRLSSALRRLLGRRRDLLPPEARAEWVRRQTKRQTGTVAPTTAPERSSRRRR